MLYLIAHKVRGELAFDIAEQMEVGTEIWWIIPTSGHRAYPFWDCHLESLLADAGVNMAALTVPVDLRDHYTILNTPRRSERAAVPTAEDL